MTMPAETDIKKWADIERAGVLNEHKKPEDTVKGEVVFRSFDDPFVGAIELVREWYRATWPWFCA